MMISTPNRIGPRHFGGRRSRTAPSRARGDSSGGSRQVPASSARRRTKFSIITTAPSTIRPKSIAPERHEVGRHAEQPHADEAGQHRQRDHGRDDQRGADVAQEEEQDRDDQQRPLDQVLADRVRRAVDDLGLVVERHDGDAGRQRLPRSRRCVALARSATSLPFSPFSMITMPATASPRPSRVTAPSRGIAPTPTVGHVRHQHRHAVDRPSPRRSAGPAIAGGQADAAHVYPLGPVLDEAAAERRVVRAEGVGRPARSVRPVLFELTRVDDDVVLLRQAAPRVDLAHAAAPSAGGCGSPSRGASCASMASVFAPSTRYW